jgi:hypothetical protein
MSQRRIKRGELMSRYSDISLRTLALTESVDFGRARPTLISRQPSGATQQLPTADSIVMTRTRAERPDNYAAN